MINVLGPQKQFLATCKSCGVVLGYNYTDTFIHKYTVKKGFRTGYGAYRCITCPVCKSRVKHNGSRSNED